MTLQRLVGHINLLELITLVFYLKKKKIFKIVCLGMYCQGHFNFMSTIII